MANETEQSEGARIRLDAITLQNRSEHLPPAMREPFIWFGSYVRDECAHSLDLLMDRFAALKITHDKTTWAKILRGMWKRDAKGHETASPCLAEDKFLRAIDQLRKDARVKARGGKIAFVMTSTAELIFNYIEIKRAPDRVNKFGIIIGETGTQKTATIDHFCSLNNHGTCVSVDAPERPSMSQFMTDLSKAFGYSGTSAYGKQKSYVLEAVTNKNTIIVENVQRLYDERFKSKQPIFSFLQKLQEDTGCTVIITFTPDFESIFVSGISRNFFEQFEGRAGGRRAFLRLAQFPPSEDILQIAEAFGLKNSEKHEDYLVAIANEPGRVRRLFEDLQDAKIAADRAGAPLNIKHVWAERGDCLHCGGIMVEEKKEGKETGRIICTDCKREGED